MTHAALNVQGAAQVFADGMAPFESAIRVVISDTWTVVAQDHTLVRGPSASAVLLVEVKAVQGGAVTRNMTLASVLNTVPVSLGASTGKTIGPVSVSGRGTGTGTPSTGELSVSAPAGVSVGGTGNAGATKTPRSVSVGVSGTGSGGGPAPAAPGARSGPGGVLVGVSDSVGGSVGIGVGESAWAVTDGREPGGASEGTSFVHLHLEDQWNMGLWS